MSLTRRNAGRLALSGLTAGILARRALAQGVGNVTLGVSAPITGNQAQYGQDIRRGAELAVERLAQANIVPGATFTLLVEDSKGDPQEAANVAQKFAARGGVTAVVGDFSSTASLAAAPIYQRAGIVMLTPTASHPDITKAGNFIFRNTPIAASEADAVTDWATKDLNLRRIAVIGRNDDYGRAYGELFRKRSQANGATVVGEEYINADTQDLKPLITGMRARRPDGVLLAMFQVEAALLFRQSVEMNFRPTFLSGAGLFNPQLISLARSAANGMLLVSTYYPGSDRPPLRSFVDLYRAKHNEVPSKFVAHAFDAVNLLADAVRRAGSADRPRVRDALSATRDFAGVTGDISFDADREVVMPLQRLMVANEDFAIWRRS